ncbi:hypothetical protein HDU85_002949 [Gaertneriomyces sp. JEL0708]|nr:hypothetical protein HDU85_002949 [Gaertneriomyces sp. JEL0708]
MSTSDVTIRRASASDLDVDALCQIGRATFAQTFGGENTEEDMNKYLETRFSREQVLKELSNPDSVFWISFSGSRPVGYMKVNYGGAQTERRLEEEAEIERIYVDEAFLGQRIGKRLLNVALEEATQNRKTALWLGVWEKNVRALAFYDRNGFRQIGQHIFRLGDDEQTDFIMWRSISGC